MQSEFADQSQDNQFDLVSAIRSNQQAHQQADQQGEVMQAEQYKVKIDYYHKLLKDNKRLLNQLKEIDGKLNLELNNISMKRELIGGKFKPRIKSQRSRSVMNKYKQLDSVKKQLAVKRLQNNSVQDLQDQISVLKASYKQKYAEAEMKKRTLNKLQSIAQSKQQEDSLMLNNNSSLISQNFLTVVKELKQQIKIKTTKVYEQKQKFIDESKRRKRKSESALAMKIPEEIQESSPIVVELKLKYEAIGHRIEVLKGHRRNLIEQKKSVQQRRKYLQKLKTKLLQLTKA